MTAPRRRWLRFSLRTLFAVVAVAGVCLGSQIHKVIARNRCRAWIESHNGNVKTYRGVCDYEPDYEALPVIRRILGDKAAREIWLSGTTTDAEAEQVCQAFPEADVMRGDGIDQIHRE